MMELDKETKQLITRVAQNAWKAAVDVCEEGATVLERNGRGAEAKGARIVAAALRAGAAAAIKSSGVL